jgi:hypothetical protein
MSSTPITTASRRRKLAIAGATLAALLLLPAVAVADPKPVPPPSIPGVPGLAGPVAPAAVPAANMGILKATPDTAPGGTKFTLSGSGLAAGKDVSIVWMTANVSYVLDARPDTVDYIGRSVSKFGVVLGKTTTDSKGAFSLELTAPKDFGGIHDIYAVVDGKQVSKGGFLVSRTVTISPLKGPIGTPITITVTGLGSSQYESEAAVLYDNHFTGLIAGNTTRGTATVQIRAAGGLGVHQIEVYDASHVLPYLNIEQSPLPWLTPFQFGFTLTKGSASLKPRVEMPVSVQPTVDVRTTMSAGTAASSGAASAKLSTTSGPILTKVGVTATGLTPNVPVDLEWATVVGNRVNCTGTCWSAVQVPLGKQAATSNGSLAASITVPDGLGGWHAVQLIQNGEVKAQVPYFVNRSFVSISKTVKAGQRFTIHLKGVGWTQIDNTLAVTYDNSLIGYGCGFNSQGDVVMNLLASGAPGTHLIDIYPMLYTQQPAYPYPPLGMMPLLSFNRDAPGLALGYALPAFHLAVTVVK